MLPPPGLGEKSLASLAVKGRGEKEKRKGGGSLPCLEEGGKVGGRTVGGIFVAGKEGGEGKGELRFLLSKKKERDIRYQSSRRSSIFLYGKKGGRGSLPSEDAPT